MATSRPTARGTKSPVDDEFLQQLYRGGELLAAGKVIEAKDFLERAHRLQPRNEKGQNLLGLAYFKLGLFDRAAELYEMLVRENPADATLRVNLGLVYLKTTALQRAVREFQTAVDLTPEHKKAHNYLGLALAQSGEYGRAREHFIAAGSDAMAEKMARAIAGEGFQRPSQVQPAKVRGFQEIDGTEAVVEQGGVPVATPAPLASAPATPPPVPGSMEGDWGAHFEPPPAAAEPPAPPAPADALRFAEDEGPGMREGAHDGLPTLTLTEEEAGGAPPTAADDGWDARAVPPGLVPAGAREEGAADAAFSETAAALASAPPARPPTPAPVRGAPALDTVLAALALPEGGGEGGFRVGPEGATLAVDGELLVRLDAVVAARGELTRTGEFRRARGRATEAPFGEGARRVVRLSGRGLLHVAVPGATLASLALGEGSAYFREGAVLAFEEPVLWENGRMPGDVPDDGADLDLVHLRGAGRVLLALPGPLRSLAVREGDPAWVPLAHLVGWQGGLAPRLEPLFPGAEALGAAGLAVRLEGEGFALLAPAVR